MEPLQRAAPRPLSKARKRKMVRDIADASLDMGEKLSWKEATALYEKHVGQAAEVWLNSTYTVYVARAEPDPKQPVSINLSIKRNDREPITDWRDKQAIKNQIVGPECEAVELYPAESRLVDSANQYHLWACPDPTWRFPLGFIGKYTLTAEEAQRVGAKQRD